MHIEQELPAELDVKLVPELRRTLNDGFGLLAKILLVVKPDWLHVHPP